MRFQRPNSQEPKIELTPMIDVVFLLLIFFMVTTTFITAPGLKVRLPETSSQEIAEEKSEINLVLTADGKIYMGAEERPIEERALSREFLAAKNRNPDTTVIIRADREASHGFVVRVMDLARQADLRRLAIATESRPEQPGR